MAVGLAQPARCARCCRRSCVRVLAAAKPTSSRTAQPAHDDVRMQAIKLAALSAVAGDLLLAGNAHAAQAVADIAASDNRTSVLLSLFLPVLGWVAFNIFGPAMNQLDSMSSSKKSLIVGTGLGLATVLAAGQADAAQEAMQLSSDNRTGVLLALFLPVLGWVAFNIFGPAMNQLDSMSGSKKSVVVGSGLGLASLLAANHADAAQQVLELADKDNRITVLLALFLPVAGWVAFNIFGPALNQLDQMSKKNK